MNKSEFLIKKMDCPSEETLIRMKLEGITEIKSLRFDIAKRKLTVIHSGNLHQIELSIKSLNFDSSLLNSEEMKDNAVTYDSEEGQSSLLWKVLIINFVFFVIEMMTGFFSRSMGLIADSLDMLADALVYGLSLFAVGGTIFKKKRIAKLSGYFQFLLAVMGIVEVIRRFLEYEDIPDFRTMIIVSLLALIGNGTCLYLLHKSKSEEAHMKASMIFTSNDVIINIGVMMAGSLVYLLNSKYPDLIIGSIVFLIVLRGSFTIFKISR
jgi:Co/Zn/Cd efflux system component